MSGLLIYAAPTQASEVTQTNLIKLTRLLSRPPKMPKISPKNEFGSLRGARKISERPVTVKGATAFFAVARDRR